MTGNPQLLYIFLSLGSGLILLTLALQGWRRRHIAGSSAFIVMMLSVAIWALAYAVEVAANTPEAMLTAQRFKYFGVTTVPVTWLLFAGRYSGRILRFRPVQIMTLLIVPVISMLLIWTSASHNLFFVGEIPIISTAGFESLDPNYGAWWGINLVYSYILILIGAYWLIITSVESIDLQQSQSQMVLLGVAIPVLGNIVTLTNIAPLRGLDLAPMLFTISAVIFERFLLQTRSMVASPISYHAIIDNLPEAVMVADAGLNILSVNPPLLRLLRQDEETMLGKSLHTMMPDIVPFVGQQPSWISSSHDIVMSGRYLELSISALDNVQDEIDAYVLTFRDNTIRKQTENALYGNERRYRTLFENSQDAIFIMDLDTTLIVVNTEAARLLDTDYGKLLQHGIQHYILESEYAKFRDYIDQLLDSELIPLYETAFVRFDGTQVPTEVNLTLVYTSEGEALQVQMIVRDISDRKQAEQMRERRLEQYQVLREVDVQINHSLDIGNVIQVSLDAAMRLSNAKAGFIATAHDEAILVDEVQGLYWESFKQRKIRYDEGLSGLVLETHEAVYVPDVTKNPHYKEFIPNIQSLMAFPLVSQERLVGILQLETTEADGFSQNIFDFLKLLVGRVSVAIENARLYDYVSKQLTETEGLNEELRKAELLKTDMIRIANHDIKNPLSIAQGYVSIMQYDIDKLPPEYEEYFSSMWKSLGRIQGILDDFMSVDAINQRASGATMTTLDMHDLVMQAIEEYQPQIFSKAQGLTINLCHEGNAWVSGDESQLYEAVTNILGNASKYTPDGGSITVELGIDSDNTVIYKVIDKGFGIPEDRQGRMFEPFYRAKVAEAANIDGTGLGMYLVKNIIERHNGDMIFHSVYQQGSTFGFKLPLVEAEDDPRSSSEMAQIES
ncbi:MAG: histidine kinase N-terminal 7TM domain-containing protein [Anaerolineae bacterium]|nr:histidine kinase N-terminal 7TM domain-containing protein [Anaerolineae bacterium]MDQ7035070.1 histidine kinase N-terminal 7TM domain-containing protein [Anaerolineae bacterium]